MDRNDLVALVQRAQSKDSVAMEELFAHCYNDVYYFALKTLKDSDLACDITQDTFLEVVKSIDRLKEPAAFEKWLKMITYHQCTRYFRKKKDVLVTEDEDGNTLFDELVDYDGAVVPQQVYEDEEFRSTIMGMIDELSEEQRSAVMLYYFEELSVSEIAQIQDVSDGTVKSRLNYARKGLKKSVESYEKKYGIKLHSLALAPLFILFFVRREVMPTGKALEIKNIISDASKSSPASPSSSSASATSATSAATASATSATTASLTSSATSSATSVATVSATSAATSSVASVAASTATTATTASSTSAATATATSVASTAVKGATSGGIMSKIAALPVVTKVIAVVAAGAIAAGAVAGAVALAKSSEKNTDDYNSQTAIEENIEYDYDDGETGLIIDESGESDDKKDDKSFMDTMSEKVDTVLEFGMLIELDMDFHLSCEGTTYTYVTQNLSVEELWSGKKIYIAEGPDGSVLFFFSLFKTGDTTQ